MDEGGLELRFVVDGDGQRLWKHAGTGFYQLKKYCIENYAFNLAQSNEIYERTEDEIRSKLVDILKIKKGRPFSKSESFDSLGDLLESAHITQARIDQLDGSELMPLFLPWLGYSSQRELWDSIFDKFLNESRSISLDEFLLILGWLIHCENGPTSQCIRPLKLLAD
ncbi:MAG: hypothetical protein U5K56_02775 [Halioglobus sp.]|nr:hypothetical protein [Halioglobus sp.]